MLLAAGGGGRRVTDMAVKGRAGGADAVLSMLVSRYRTASRREDEGFTLVELMAALTILMVGIVALAQLTVSVVTATLRTRQREAAVAEATTRIENFRASDYTNLALATGTTPAPPATYVGDDGVTYKTVTSPTGNVTYQSTVTASSFTFTVRQIVAGVDDPADGTGTVGPTPDADGELVDYKKVFVEITSTKGPSFTYKVESILRNTATDPVVAVQGIHLEVLDGDVSPPARVTDDRYQWTVDIIGSGVLGQPVEEGIYNNFNLPVGAFSCVISSTLSTATWHPTSSPSATSITVPCSVSSGSITNVVTTWADTGCKALGTVGDLRVTVVDSSTGAPINNASVDPAPRQSQPDPAARPTNGSGLATFTGLGTGAYDLAASAAGFTPATGAACVYEADVAEATVGLSPVSATSGSVAVRIKAKSSETVRVKVGSVATLDATLSKDEIRTLTLSATAGTYDVFIYCVDSKGKENLKKTWSAKTVTAGATLYLPGPGSTEAEDIKC